jgi:hypothetical protein
MKTFFTLRNLFVGLSFLGLLMFISGLWLSNTNIWTYVLCPTGVFLAYICSFIADRIKESK